MKEVCKMDGCNGEHYRDDYCSKHHQRVRRHGDPHINLKKKVTDVHRVEIKNMLRSGMTVKEIALKYKLSLPTIYEVRKISGQWVWQDE